MTTELIMFLVTFLSQNLYRLDENAEKEKKKKTHTSKKIFAAYLDTLVYSCWRL